MFRSAKPYIGIALLLSLGLLFSACDRGIPHETENQLTETTVSATNETPVFYESAEFPLPDDSKIPASVSVTMRRFHYSGYGVDTKTIMHKGYALMLSQLLQNAPKTGTIIPALSDEEQWVTEHSGILPAVPGTLWIDTQNGLFRLTKDDTALCRVENHFGEGKELEMNEELRALILNLWQYYPYNYYAGTYEDGKLHLTHRFAAESDIEITVKDAHISRGGETSTITVEVHSLTDQSVYLSLDCQQSDDNLGLGDGKRLEMKKGETQTLTLSFVGWRDIGYEIVLTADNTRVWIWIMP